MDFDAMTDAEFETLVDRLAVIEEELSSFTIGDRFYGDDELVRPKEVMRALGCSRGTLYTWIKTGKLPRPRKLSTRVTGWRAETIETWLKQFDGQGAEQPT